MEVRFESERIKQEYERWFRHFGGQDLYDSSATVGLLDVLRAHFLVADYFYEKDYGLGGVGPRDPELLHSAVYRQFVSFGGRDKWPDFYHKCASLIFGIVKDHPFHDANKRTGLLTMLYALHKMNRTPTAKHKELEDLMVQIAEGKLDKFARQRKLAKRDDDADVLFIADYLKRNSRQRDSRYYTITYQELDRRLRDFSFCLCNPHNNCIDVARIETYKPFLGLGKEKTKLIRIAQIGFPSWKSQVGKGAIATVRREAGLTAEKGIDSAAFFQGADPLNALIDIYAGPLQRLAFR